MSLANRRQITAWAKEVVAFRAQVTVDAINKAVANTAIANKAIANKGTLPAPARRRN